jgi:7-keto-8-aminopelargonate synthetase-like enzyme
MVKFQHKYVMRHSILRNLLYGCVLSRAEVQTFTRNDAGRLERQLLRMPRLRDRRFIIVADAISSLQGNILNLPEFVALARRYDCVLYVDEASSLGQLGENSRGLEERFSMPGTIDVRVGTLAKALVSYGGFAACGERLGQLLRFKYGATFSTSITETQAVIGLAALDILRSDPSLIQRLTANAAQWREGLRQLGVDVGASSTAIVPVFFQSRKSLAKIYSALLENDLSACQFPIPGQRSTWRCGPPSRPPMGRNSSTRPWSAS